mmetsp:Transcript_7649/g.8405  ORF Transcript_7649/g.8405 Transcript_7649/m.8405 type:complete len:1044 (+) Transcript_7649:102-3233(+)
MAVTGAQAAQQGVEDMVLISAVDEPSIVENIKKRYDHDQIYTNIGAVLISVNPFRWIKGITDDEQVEEYRGRFRHELPPNVFALAEEAYRSVKGEQMNQCVIITGESGAGKTVAAKLIMKYVAAVSSNSEEIQYVKQVILDSNPVLEAFGNAKTLRNNNSSRFGKYFDIRFNRYGDPCGGFITTYLLEKSRVTSQLKGERNFHIFYQILNGSTQQEVDELQLYSPEYFSYLAGSGCYTVDSIDDAEEYAEVRKGFNTLGFPATEVQAIIRLLAGILHLGNIQFQENAQSQSSVVDQNPVNLAAGLFKVNPEALCNCLLTRRITTGGRGGGSEYDVPNNNTKATAARDALSKAMYSRMFDRIVAVTNVALEKKKLQHSCVIGVLDIYGFEIFDNNGFEQFCINFVNEKLQQYFIQLTLKKEQEEYNDEGIQWTPIKFFNNQIVCDLIEAKRPPGIFSVLDDVCATMHSEEADAADLKFLDKAGGFFSGNLHFRKLKNAFEVKHYAGSVTYETRGFCEKNKDILNPDIIKVMKSSQLQYLVELFPEDVTQKQSRRPTTVGYKIKTSAADLINQLSQCQPHYIRCIKPNETKQPKDWDAKRVQHQVQYLGILENVRVCRAGYCYRAPYQRFLNRYKKLSSKTWGSWGEWSGPPMEGVKIILTESVLDASQYQFGRTKVFVRHPESLFYLEECLERHDYECALLIQKAWRRWKAKKKALEQRAKAASLLLGKKERRRESVNIKFDTDYMCYESNFSLQGAMGKYIEEPCVFADQTITFSRRGRPERRDFVLTTNAFYVLMRIQKGGQQQYTLMRRVPLDKIAKVSMSTLQDNWVVFHCQGGETDFAFETKFKTECVTVLSESYEAYARSKLSLNFSDSITYNIQAGSSTDTRTLAFQKDEGAQPRKVKKSGKTLTIMINSGLDKNTNTTPQGFQATPTASVPRSSGPKKTMGGMGGGMRGNTGGGASRPGPKKMGFGAPKGPKMLPKGKPAQPQAKALYDYQGSTAEELSFGVGDVIIVHQKDPGGWWEGELNGKRGWVPANYLQEM